MSELDLSAKDSLHKTDSVQLPSVDGRPVVSLPAELLTGHETIDFGHDQLLACMQTLRSLCQEASAPVDCAACPTVTRAHCESRLVGLLGDLLAFILDHFKNEEMIMRDSMLQMVDREVCQAHMEDHANIAAKVQEIIVALEPLKTVQLLRDLDELLVRWVHNHAVLHDQLLCRWLASRAGELNYRQSL